MRSPLGHTSPSAFKVLYALVAAGEPLDLETIIRRIPRHWRQTTVVAVDALLAGGVLAQGEGRLRLSVDVPRAYPDLVRQIGEHLGLDTTPSVVGPRPAAFTSAADGAPRLFGSDARLRNLMALAAHGPMLYTELRSVTGAGHFRLEEDDDAPFGQAGLVRTFGSGAKAVVAPDEAHPLHPSLRRLLVRLAEIYPLPPHVPVSKMPALPPEPPEHPWVGDTDALFGGPIPTRTLMSIGVLGWTFEALCCAASITTG